MSDETSDLPRWLLLRDEEVLPTEKQVVNDVKITELDGVTVTNNGGIGLVVTTVSGTVRILGSDEVAALREHFAAEQPAPEVNSDGMPYNNASRDELVGILSRWLGVPEVNVRRIWQPATPTPSEVIDWIENRSPHTLLVAVKEAREHFAALVSPVFEQPTPLDPEPWVSLFTDSRSSVQVTPAWNFIPGQTYEQAREAYPRARYEQGGEVRLR